MPPPDPSHFPPLSSSNSQPNSRPTPPPPHPSRPLLPAWRQRQRFVLALPDFPPLPSLDETQNTSFFPLASPSSSSRPTSSPPPASPPCISTQDSPPHSPPPHFPLSSFPPRPTSPPPSVSAERCAILPVAPFPFPTHTPSPPPEKSALLPSHHHLPQGFVSNERLRVPQQHVLQEPLFDEEMRHEPLFDEEFLDEEMDNEEIYQGQESLEQPSQDHLSNQDTTSDDQFNNSMSPPPFTYLSTEADPCPSAMPTCFYELFIILADDLGIDLSSHDLGLFIALPLLQFFPFGRPDVQLKSHGLCVQIPQDVQMPFLSSHFWAFVYGPQQRAVYVDIKRLTPTGLSILTWLLQPCLETLGPLIAVCNAISFDNCLAKAVRRLRRQRKGWKLWYALTDWVSKGEPGDIVIPRGWLYWLDVRDSFVQAHGEYADMAVRLGWLPGRGRDRNQGSSWEMVSSGGNSFGISKKKGGRLEYLELDADNQLVYTRMGKKMEYKSVNVAANGPAAGFSMSMARDYVPSYIEMEKYRAGSMPVRFASLSQFVGFAMKGSDKRGLMKRMKWLEEALHRKNVFPSGRNQMFLICTTGYASMNDERVQVFEKEDCRVTRTALLKNHCVEELWHGGERAELFIVEEGDDGEEVHEAVCCGRGPHLWIIQYPFKASLPSGTMPVTRDLG